MLLQAGRRVLLLERDLSTPDRIVGELLQPGGYRILERLGLAGCCSDIDAQKVRSLMATLCSSYGCMLALSCSGAHDAGVRVLHVQRWQRGQD